MGCKPTNNSFLSYNFGMLIFFCNCFKNNGNYLVKIYINIWCMWWLSYSGGNQSLKVEKKPILCKIYSEIHYLEPLAHGDSKYLIPA